MNTTVHTDILLFNCFIIYSGSDDSVIDTSSEIENDKTENSSMLTGDLILHFDSYYDKMCLTLNVSNESGHLKRLIYSNTTVHTDI